MDKLATVQENAQAEIDAEKERQLAQRRRNTRIVRFALPQVDENSALLPTDKWAMDALWDFAKKNKSFHRNAGGLAGSALGSVATLVAGTIGVFAVSGVVAVAAVAVAGLGLAGFLAKKAHDFFGKLKTETVAEMRTDIGKKYVELKASELKAAWQKKKDELAQKKAAEKAAKAEAAAKAETAKPVEAATAATTAATPANTATAKEETPKPKGDSGNVKTDVGGWLLKKAMEQAQKHKEKKDAAAKTDVKPGDTPATGSEQPAKKNNPPPPKAA